MGKLTFPVTLVDGPEVVSTSHLFVDSDITCEELFVAIEDAMLIPAKHIITITEFEFKASERVKDHKTNGMVLKVEHGLLQIWKTKLKSAKNIDKLTEERQGKEAETILEAIDILQKAKLFLCYPSFEKEKMNLLITLPQYCGGNLMSIKYAAATFFFDQTKKTNSKPETFKIDFGIKSGGIHAVCRCKVSYENISENYFIKMHHMGPTKTQSKACDLPDLREVFCYQLLHQIGVGPECFFFTSTPGSSKITLYIATKEIPNLSLMKKLTPSTKNIEETIIQMHFLTFLLCLADVHGDNCGQDEKGEATLFDFYVPPRSDYKEKIERFENNKPMCVDTVENMMDSGGLSEMAENVKPMKRKEIAVSVIKSWKLNEVLPVVEEKVNETKEMLRSRGLIIERTNYFEQYLQGVRHNISLLLVKN